MARSSRRQRRQRQPQQSPPPEPAAAPEPEEASVGEAHEVEFDEELRDEVDPRDLIPALDPLRQTRRSPLVAGIRMFSAMLGEARGGYVVERLEYLEATLSIEFNNFERDGILGLSLSPEVLGEDGVPDVEYAVQMALEARAEAGGAISEEFAVIAEGLGGGPQDEEEPPPAPVEPPAGRPQSASEIAAAKALEAEREEADRATAEAEEDEDPDAPGADE